MGISFSRRDKEDIDDSYLFYERANVERQRQSNIRRTLQPRRHTFHLMPNGMVGLTVNISSFSNPQAQRLVRQRYLAGWYWGNPNGVGTIGSVSEQQIGNQEGGLGNGNKSGAGGGASRSHRTASKSHQTLIPNQRGRAREGTGSSKTNHEIHEHKSKAENDPTAECLEWEPSCMQDETCGKSNRGREEQEEIKTQKMLKATGLCVMGFNWIRQEYHGWRCWGGNHFVFDNQQAADAFVRKYVPGR